MSDSTLVVGGTGKTGRRICDGLRRRGVPTRVASRSGERRFDWHDRQTWGPALAGARAAYVAYYPDLALPGAAAHIEAFSRAAVDQGVERIVLLSGRGEPRARESEDAVRRSGAQWTIVRSAFFFQNFSEGALREAVLAGEVAFPAGEVAEPFVDADDVADVAVAALTEERHAGRTYELTGPSPLTFAEVVSAVSSATGWPVRYVPVTAEAFAHALAHAMPADEATFFADLFAQLLDGHNAHTTRDVEGVLGRPARALTDFLRSALESGVFRRLGPA